MNGQPRIALTAALLLGLEVAAGASGWEPSHAEAASTALRYLRKYFCKTAEQSCCLTLHGEAPPSDLMTRLRDLPQYRPFVRDGSLARDVCGVLDADVSDVLTTKTHAQVTVTFGSKGSWSVCKVKLGYNGGHWTPDAKQRGCVQFQ